MSFGAIGGSNAYVSYPAGDFDGSGAFTMAMLISPGSNNVRLMDWFNSATEQRFFLIDTGALYGDNDFSSGYGGPFSGTSGWQLLAMSKPSGSAHYRFHTWAYDAAGAGTMAHGESVGAANQPNKSAATTCRMGFAVTSGLIGSVAIASWWDRVLSDAELDTLKTNQLTAWNALTPDLGVHYGSWAGSSGDVIFSGSSGAGTPNGSATANANPTGFNFNIIPPGPTAPLLQENGRPILLETGIRLKLD